MFVRDVYIHFPAHDPWVDLIHIKLMYEGRVVESIEIPNFSAPDPGIVCTPIHTSRSLKEADTLQVKVKGLDVELGVILEGDPEFRTTIPASGPVEKEHSFTLPGSPAIPPPERGTLFIDTTPVKGEVFVNGESWGKAPQQRELAPGTYLVSFGEVEGYRKPQDVQATVLAGQVTNIKGVYEPIAVPAPPTEVLLALMGVMFLGAMGLLIYHLVRP